MTNKPVGPALRKRQLAKHLADLRAAAGLSTTQVAQALRIDRTQINHFEAARRTPRYTDLVVMLQLYGASDQLEDLDAMRDVADARGWWEIPGMASATRMYLGLEADAQRVRCFAQELVPGMVQNADYARDVEALYGSTADAVAQAVTTRMRRQERIGSGVTVEVIVSEGLLWRTLHMGQVGADQLRWLLNTAGVPGVRVQVLEYATGGHRAMTGSYTLLDFPQDLAPPVGYLTYAQGAHLVDDPDVVVKLGELFEDLSETAVDVENSAALAVVMTKVEAGR